ncbi:hypothetical protein ACFVAJ_17310 [Agromyces sp. NPDC057679]|uniref:hypothetical protein n=1 Tax=Agromyces sp. NPDC057679 TaxID=3346207 RepID=UPI003671A604
MTSRTATLHLYVTLEVPVTVAIDEAEYADWTDEPLTDDTAERFLRADRDNTWLSGVKLDGDIKDATEVVISRATLNPRADD